MAAGCAKTTETPGVATAAGSNPKSTASAAPSAEPYDPIKYSECMRDNGMSWFPDPVDGKMTVAIPADVDKGKLKEAEEACRQYAPNGGERPEPDPEALELGRQMAKCMRENGVPNFPDPEPDGGIAIDSSKLGTGPGDPTFDKAEQACSKHRPSGAVERHVEGNTAGGGGA
jgi:hypothetical protein